MTLGNKTIRSGIDLEVAAHGAAARLRALAPSGAGAPAEPAIPVTVAEAAPPADAAQAAMPETAAFAVAEAPVVVAADMAEPAVNALPDAAAAIDTAAAPPSASAVPPAAPEPPKQSLVRRAARHVYRRMKPLVRPVLWRLRSYLNHPVSQRFDQIEAALQQQKAELAATAAASANGVAARLAVIDSRSASLETSVAALSATLADLAQRASNEAGRPQWLTLEQLANSWAATAPVLQAIPLQVDGLAANLGALAKHLERVEEIAQLAALRTERLQRIEGFVETAASRSERLERIEGFVEAAASRSERLERIEGLAEMVSTRSERLERIEASVESVTTQMQRLQRIEDHSGAAAGQVPRLERIEGLAHAAAAQSERLERIEGLAQGLVVRGERLEQIAFIPEHLQRLERIESYALHAAQRVAVPTGNDEVLVRTAVGYMLCAASDRALLAALLEGGELERGTRLLIERLLRPGDTFLDVGANIGMHTMAAARALQGRGRVIAFEPYGPTARLLAGSAWLNGFAGLVEVHEAAVSRAAGTQALHIGATSGHHSLYDLDDQSVAPATVDVPVVRLDDLILPGTTVQLLKVDVEGAELDVVEGARELVRSNPSMGLIVEYGGSHLRRTGNATGDWLRAFAELGLDYKAIDPDTGLLTACSERELERQESVNLLFARPESAAWTRAEKSA